MFYGGPKEAILQPIYRQKNSASTTSSSAPSTPTLPTTPANDIWDGLVHSAKFDELKGGLIIKPVKVGFAAFTRELGRVGWVDDRPKGSSKWCRSGRSRSAGTLRKGGELPDRASCGDRRRRRFGGENEGQA